MLREWLNRLWGSLRRNAREREIEEELRRHLEFAAEQEGSERAARVAYGGVTQAMESMRDQRGLPWIDNLVFDLRYGLRTLRKSPGFTSLTVLILALGIGANTAVFSMVNAVMLKPLAYRDADRIVTLSTLWKKTGADQPSVSVPDYHDWHDQNTSFEAMAYFQAGDTAVIAGPAAEFAADAAVTNEFFEVFDVHPVAGRPFSEEESKSGSGAAAMISYSFWQSHYGGEWSALGKPLQLGGHALRIAGVLPPGFRFPEKTDIWFPANTMFRESTIRAAHNVQVVGKLKPGVALERAQSEMTAIGGRLEQQFPQSNASKNIKLRKLRDDMVKDARLMLYLLLGAVGLVLLVACGNVANLLLAKSTTRGREIALRAALGAGRARIVRQLFAESMLLALMAGATGLVFAVASSRALVLLAPANVPRLENTGVDGRVLGFAFAASVLACLIFGLVPAIRTTRVDLNTTMKQIAAQNAGASKSRFRQALVAIEIALSAVLLVGAGLFIRSFAALHDVALGFKPEHVLLMETSVTARMTAQQAMPVYKRLIEEISSIPGVIAAGATRTPPGTVRSNGPYWVDEAPTPQQISVSRPLAIFSYAGPGIFAALGVPVHSGREFRATDTFDAPPRAIVNQALANRAFPGQDPIGHTIAVATDSLKPMTIVGVIGDVRQLGPASEPVPEVYMPYEQHPTLSTFLTIVARTTADPGQMTGALRRKAREIAPDVPVKITGFEDRLSQNVAAPRFRTLLLAVFAALAVALAMAGVYGVVSFIVNHRTPEIGLRMALGATSQDVLKMMLLQGLRLAIIGLAAGMAAAFAASHLLSTMLFGVKPTDPLTYAAVVALMAMITLAASYIPARRGARLDPMAALRNE
ncbi:MAG: ABC transporter permease [Bryobacterales bacterium]|nr:ABC transporter permease [Bryobacterales bacterium]MBV9398890.1 ABC transporter permease [Bryobacterales bacterium]